MGIIGSEKSQLDKFQELARAVEADEDETRWDDRLKRVAKAHPPERPAKTDR